MQMSSLHALLDATEAIVIESYYVGKDPKKGDIERDRFYDALYKPTPKAIAANDGYKPPPAGFEDGGDDGWDWSSGGAEG